MTKNGICQLRPLRVWLKKAIYLYYAFQNVQAQITISEIEMNYLTGGINDGHDRCYNNGRRLPVTQTSAVIDSYFSFFVTTNPSQITNIEDNRNENKKKTDKNSPIRQTFCKEVTRKTKVKLRFFLVAGFPTNTGVNTNIPDMTEKGRQDEQAK